MAAYVSGDVTVVVTKMRRLGKAKLHIGTMAIAGGGPTYPTAGIPLPSISAFGFVQQMDSLKIFGNNARTVDYKWSYNKAAHKLMGYEDDNPTTNAAFLEIASGAAPAAITLDWEAIGW